jgi:Uma2 family endonuclease
MFEEHTMSNTAKRQPEPITVDEFMRWPGDPRGRIAELADGVIRLQDPASDTHNTVFSNLVRLLGNHLETHRPTCRVVATAGIRPQLGKRQNWRVPEIAVTCTPNKRDVHATEGAVLIVEVLSPSNRRDTWDNVPHYASVPTVQEILVLDSESVEAHVLRRLANGNWPDDPTVLSAEATIELQSIGMTLNLSGAYRNTWLAPS